MLFSSKNMNLLQMYTKEAFLRTCQPARPLILSCEIFQNSHTKKHSGTVAYALSLLLSSVNVVLLAWSWRFLSP